MKKQQLAALCLAAGLALTGITSPVSAAQTGTGISMSANSTDTTIFPEQAVQTTQITQQSRRILPNRQTQQIRRILLNRQIQQIHLNQQIRQSHPIRKNRIPR